NKSSRTGEKAARPGESPGRPAINEAQARIWRSYMMTRVFIRVGGTDLGKRLTCTAGSCRRSAPTRRAGSNRDSHMTKENPVRFGINFLPNRALELVEWVKTAEDTGFDIAGIADSQSLYRDVYICEALAAVNTRKIRIGTRVINPLTRHPAVAACAAATMEELAPGRTMVGIGTGDSAVDNIGVRPSTRGELTEYIKTLRELLTTGLSKYVPAYSKGTQLPVGMYTGKPVKMTWWNNKNIPIYIAASGPLTLQLAGEIANGVVINTGLLPEIVRDSIQQVKIGCERAGRDISEVDMWWLPLTNVDDDRERAINEIAPTLASAGSHLSRFTTKGKHIPEALMSRVSELGRR
ncbi:MAG: LLM class flavin-dependent oxidoreductase, partial [Bradyrhizobium sp.]